MSDKKLNNKIKELIEQIKKQPSNNNLRLELIQYYCLDGNWKKGLSTTENYLKINSSDENSKILLYANIASEILREQVLVGAMEATIYPNCNESIFNQQKQLLSNYLKSDNIQATTALFVDVIEQIQYPHNLDIADRTLTGIWVDSDIRTAFVQEIFSQNKYYWIPFSDISKIIFKDNQYLTDVLWRRGEIHLTDGRVIPSFMPARYVLTESYDSDSIKMCQETQWEAYGDVQIAHGQKVLTNGDEDVSLLDVVEMMSVNDTTKEA